MNTNQMKITKIALGELANVRSGLILSRKESNNYDDSQCRYSLLNLKSFREDTTIDMEALDTFCTQELLESKYLTQKGDIIVRLSSPYTAVLITDQTAGLVISSGFAVIKVENTDRLLPEYLYWLLNSRFVKNDLFRHNSRNMIGAIRPLYYNDLVILLPSMAIQKEIGTLHLLARRETFLLHSLAEQKANYNTMLLENQYNELNKEYTK